MKTASHKCCKCNGTGHIAKFDWILGGRCFACNATGTATYAPVDLEIQAKQVTAEDIKRHAWVMAATPAQMASLTRAQRERMYWFICENDAAWPEMWKKYVAQFGYGEEFRN
jgi:hypothetical protein